MCPREQTQQTLTDFADAFEQLAADASAQQSALPLTLCSEPTVALTDPYRRIRGQDEGAMGSRCYVELVSDALLGARTSRRNSSDVPVLPIRWRRTSVKDLKADWRKWTPIERSAAVLIAFGMSSVLPALLLLGRG